MRHATALLMALLALPLPAWAEAAFTAKPTVLPDGAGVRIEFAVSESTDVEVAILDGGGKVVRHLAAGVIGGPKTAPPLVGGLRQSILWDRADDAGKPVAGPVSVRVRAGMAPKFGRIIGASPYVGQATDQPYRGSVRGVAVDDKGNLFVKMMSDIRSHGNSGFWPWQLRQFDPDGNYVKTLLPYPPSTDPAKASGVTLLDTPDKHFTPANQNSLYPVMHVFGPAIYGRVLKDGSVVFVNTRGRTLNFFKTDGSNELRTVPMWPGPDKINAPAWLEAEVAFSPDGRYAYYSGLAGSVYDGKQPGDIDPNWPNGRVYRHDLTQPNVNPEPFFDLPLPDWNQTKYWMPSAWDHRSAAAGVDTDPKGNLYVCDLVNQQVVVVSSAGKLVETVKVPCPDRVQVHPTTGDLYVLSRVVSRGGRPPDVLRKISGRGESARIVAELPLKPGNSDFTLDHRGQTPVLWVLAKGDTPSGQSLLRVEDRGGELVVAKDIFARDPDALAFVGNLTVDRQTNQVYVTNTSNRTWRYDGKTGQGGPFKVGASDLSVRDGKLYRLIGWNSGIARFTLDGKPDPLTDLEVPTRKVENQPGVVEFGSYYGRAGRGCSVGGIFVDHRGWIWALQEGGGMFVKAYKPDGTPVTFEQTVVGAGEKAAEGTPAAITGFDIRAGCIRVDRQGNIYVGYGYVPKDHKPPAGYEKDAAYKAAIGTVLKFGPKGGRSLALPNAPKLPENTVMGFEGVLEVYPGFAPFSAWRCDGSCICCKPRFDLDGFGRLFIPNAITFSVAVTDNAGNRIVQFGHYGNFDAQGPGSVELKPEIPLGWPTGAGVCGDYVYIGDVLNHRVVRVDLTYAAEETVAVK